jgi:hypothetical protein
MRYEQVPGRDRWTMSIVMRTFDNTSTSIIVGTVERKQARSRRTGPVPTCRVADEGAGRAGAGGQAGKQAVLLSTPA